MLIGSNCLVISVASGAGDCQALKRLENRLKKHAELTAKLMLYSERKVFYFTQPEDARRLKIAVRHLARVHRLQVAFADFDFSPFLFNAL